MKNAVLLMLAALVLYGCAGDETGSSAEDTGDTVEEGSGAGDKEIAGDTIEDTDDVEGEVEGVPTEDEDGILNTGEDSNDPADTSPIDTTLPEDTAVPEEEPIDY